MAENYLKVQKGFRILQPLLAGYVAQEMSREYRNAWWQEVLSALSDQTRDLPDSGEYAALVDSLDVANCLRLFDRKWNDLFRKKLSLDYRTWSKELMGVRNKLAHLGGGDFNENDTWRALDTMSRLCEAFDDEAAEEIRELMREARYGAAEGSAAVTETALPASTRKRAGILDSTPVRGLPCWRDVVQPHPDVAQGRYKKAEFAADLAQVARGEGAAEYRDPVEFFARTYVTEGMTGLLEQALRRVSGRDGEPVIQLKTAFGGGKTHSMLALYHMLRGRVPAGKIPNIKPVLEQAGVSTLPRANVAVLVGTALEPAKSKRPQNMPGITINTLWGEMAAQLAESAGDLKLYDYVKEADKKGVAPGSETLKNLFDACGPCLILLDEIVAYGRRLYGKSGLPAGTFDDFIVFIQSLTEAARASKNSMVVATIPESKIEIGGEDAGPDGKEARAGKIVAEEIEHTFGRMESIWKPVAAGEGFEVVRRRLFLPCRDEAARDAVCARFSRMYNENPSDFPITSREVEYQERMVSCYPIHPEVFDRLYEDWATLERFQRTRGVLRLMAAVIHELWMGGDAGLLIMPGSIPLDVPAVRDELTRQLSPGWNALVDREVDGRNSIPYQKDQTNPRYSHNMAGRRVARTVMLGSAPTSRDQNVRGIESSRIRLGVVQPGENISVFNDALGTLTASLAYLYANPSSDRFWYDTRPTLRKTVEDRASKIAASDVEYEIEERLKSLRRERGTVFSGRLHICPASSLDVPDDQTARLVILRPGDMYRASSPDNAAMTAAEDILSNRGATPRIYRNMVAFAAPDQDLMNSLQQTVRRYLAWKFIQDNREELNLDAAQNRETDNNLARANKTVDDQIKEAYCWLLVPYIDKAADLKTIVWDAVRISGGNESIVGRAASKMQQNEQIITRWAPRLLKMELDSVLWTASDHIEIKTLWDYLCKYCYLPRLADENVLMDAISSGLSSTEYFAYASGFDGMRYLDLKFNQSVFMVEKSACLVKISAAQKQLAADEARRQAEEAEARAQAVQQGLDHSTGEAVPAPQPEAGGAVPQSEPGPSAPVVERPKNKRFYMNVPLDPTRIGRDVQRLVEEVISHLTSADGTQAEISLEVNIQAPDGLSQEIVRTVSENCRTLHVEDFGFED